MSGFDAQAYGPVVAGLLGRAGRMPLDAGVPNAAAGERLRELAPADLFAGRPVLGGDRAAACLSALWLRFGFLEDSHRLSQGIASPEGSFWHGIMHRREGDYANAKYWFNRVGDHPVYGRLGDAAREIAGMGDGPAARAVAARTTWDPFAFIDLCEVVVAAGKPDDLLWCQIQRAEWEILFDDCWRGATGS
jgi:hypothetical protein